MHQGRPGPQEAEAENGEAVDGHPHRYSLLAIIIISC